MEYLDTLGAAVSTANATWWLVPATALSAVFTAAAVAAAFFTQTRQFRHEQGVRTDEQLRLNRAAVRALDASYQRCREIKVEREQAGASVNIKNIWQRLGQVEAHRRVLERYLIAQLTLDDLDFALSEGMQRLFEVRDGLTALTPPEGYGRDAESDAKKREFSNATLSDALERIGSSEEGLASFRAATVNLPNQ